MSESEVTPKFGSTLPAQRHVFDGPVSVAANPALDRHAQTERTCKICGAVKVTVHSKDGRAWRAWRRGASTAQVEIEPACDLQLDKYAVQKS